MKLELDLTEGEIRASAFAFGYTRGALAAGAVDTRDWPELGAELVSLRDKVARAIPPHMSCEEHRPKNQ